MMIVFVNQNNSEMTVFFLNCQKEYTTVKTWVSFWRWADSRWSRTTPLFESSRNGMNINNHVLDSQQARPGKVDTCSKLQVKTGAMINV